MGTETVQVGLGERSYPIVIGSGVLDTVGAALAEARIGRRWAIITDDVVGPLYGGRLVDSLGAAGMDGFDRGDAVLALGGGVVGDMAGFLASIYLRGIPFVQVPTSLLAQVDSSVGGKTGVDLDQGKNLVGTFYQPRAVFIDTDVLRTLPEAEFRGGMGEVIKYGASIDADFFAFLERERPAIQRLDPAAIVPMIRRCCELKASVVERDEREGGLRRILNFGHTIGHAVEAASGYRLIHGFAVAIGMRAVAELALRGGVAGAEVVAVITNMLEAYVLPTTIPPELDRAQIRRYLQADKKSIGGRVFFVLPEAIGRVLITDRIDPADLAAVLAAP